jgi:hypothetical protein
LNVKAGRTRDRLLLDGEPRQKPKRVAAFDVDKLRVSEDAAVP